MDKRQVARFLWPTVCNSHTAIVFVTANYADKILHWALL